MQNFTLPKLPYALDALEPVISKEIMDLHYNKHHAGYVKNLNAALEKYAEAEKKGDIDAMLAALPEIEFNGGGHANHTFFWSSLAPVKEGGGKPPKGKLAELIKRDYSSFEKFVELFSEKSTAIHGSGWAFLAYSKTLNCLKIVTTFNHGGVKTLGLEPLFIVDVWEHAYYLQYKNQRGSFIKELWKIINWEEIEQKFNKAIS